MPKTETDQTHSGREGLVADLRTIAARTLARRQTLAWFAGAGATALLAGCGGGSADSSNGSSSTDSSGSSSGSSTGSGSTGTGTDTGADTGSGDTSSGTCVADASETNGPYPADGTNSSSGSTSNILTTSGIVRSDIRSSFIGSTTTAEGVVMTLTLTVVDANDGCKPLSGYAVYIWHCTADGEYSLYTAPEESYLRGVQVTDANGQVTFTTIFPGCYAGRFPHIHFEVFSSFSAATNGRSAVLISQMAPPEAVCTQIYNNVAAYSGSIRNFDAVSLETDNIFNDNSAAQMTQMTMAMSGSIAGGYNATNLIGVAV